MAGTIISRGGDAGVAVTISASGTTSTAYDARDGIAFGVFLPAGFEGGALTFTGAWDSDETFFDVYEEDGSAATLASVAASGYYPLPASLAALPWFKIVSDATESAARSLRIVSKQ